MWPNAVIASASPKPKPAATPSGRDRVRADVDDDGDAAEAEEEEEERAERLGRRGECRVADPSFDLPIRFEWRFGASMPVPSLDMR